MKKKSLLYLVLLLVGMLFLAACGTSSDEGENNNTSGSEAGETTDNGNAEEEDTSADEEKAVLKVGTDAAFAPFEYMETGEIVGFDVDLLEAVMAEAGYEYELENVGWDPLFASLQGGKVDLGISGVTINEERLESYDFSNPYFESTHMIVFNEGAGITNAEDLHDIKIGVQTGTTGQEAAEQVVGDKNENILEYETTAVAFLALQSGDVETVVTDNVVAKEYVENNPDAGVEAITDKENFKPEYYGIIFPKDSELVEDFNTALATIMENGTFTEIYKEWFGTEPDLEAIQGAAE